MTPPATVPTAPTTIDQRLALRERPEGHPVMRQRWARLLFLHWTIDPAALAPDLPPGLHVDIFEGRAWIGIVPFFMERVHPSRLPPLPGLSWFLELNVRSYVHDDDGVPGVWFHSLECNQPVAVRFARRFFQLNYRHAAMHADRRSDAIHYQCRRKRDAGEPAEFVYAPDGPAAEAEPGTLPFFLAERYLLFTSGRDGRLRRGRVHHPPYRLASARVDTYSTAPLAWNGLPEPVGPPNSALWADHVDVEIFPLR